LTTYFPRSSGGCNDEIAERGILAGNDRDDKPLSLPSNVVSTFSWFKDNVEIYGLRHALSAVTAFARFDY
jgi:hypothetical protein